MPNIIIVGHINTLTRGHNPGLLSCGGHETYIQDFLTLVGCLESSDGRRTRLQVSPTPVCVNSGAGCMKKQETTHGRAGYNHYRIQPEHVSVLQRGIYFKVDRIM